LRLTVKQHSLFDSATAARLGGSLASPDAWDALRRDERDTPFSIPAARDAWATKCAGQAWLEPRAELVRRMAARAGATGLSSYGVGTGCLEYHLSGLAPDLDLLLSDSGTDTVSRLRAVFDEAASIERVDLLHDPLPARPRHLALLNRVDTEFTDGEWRDIFERLHAGGHRHVLVLPTMFVSPPWLVREVARRVVGRTRDGREATFTGYVRSRTVYEGFWRGLYAVTDEDRAPGSEHFMLNAVKA
jgi:hypothetical protein